VGARIIVLTSGRHENRIFEEPFPGGGDRTGAAMSDQSQGKSVGSIDSHGVWHSIRFTEVFRSFRIAIHQLVPAVLTVVVLFVAAALIDFLVGGQVLPGEFERFVINGSEGFSEWRASEREKTDQWLERQLISWTRMDRARAEEIAEQGDSFAAARQALLAHYTQQEEQIGRRWADNPQRLERELQFVAEFRRQAMEMLDRNEPSGVLRTVLDVKMAAFREMMQAAVNPGTLANPQAVVDPFLRIAVGLPMWLWTAHQAFLIIWLVVFLALWALLGGAISRLTMLEAARDERIPFAESVSYARRRWVAYVMTPLAPLLFVLACGLVLAIGGLLYHVPILDIIGSLLFILAIGIGFIMALMLIGWAAGVHLMYPALSAEGGDAFDAISRAFGYVFAAPWRLIFYALLALVYGAATYLFVGIVVYLTLYLTQCAVATWMSGFGQVMPQPEWGRLLYEPDMAALSWSGKVTAVITMVWTHLVIALVAAYAISYYFASTSVIYLLLRRCCDGSDMGQCYIEPRPEPRSEADKVEPPAPEAGSEQSAPPSE
jgi:hypothetical protein